MTLEKSNMKKMCSFCVSDWHVATTIFPYVKGKAENNEKVISIFEKGIEDNIIELLKRINIDKSIKNKIAEFNWESKKWDRYEKFEYFMEENYEKSISIIINGGEKYIERINEYIDLWYSKNNSRMKQEDNNIKVISCYDISEGLEQENILQKYNYILNTSGEKRINEMLNNKNKIKV